MATNRPDDGARPVASGSWTPRVTVGLPVFNGARYLDDAIGALLSQSYRDFELVISDNASTDETPAICAAAAAADDRVRVIRQPRNLGAAGNYNALVTAARGEFFRWAPHDDLVTHDHLERLVASLDSVGPGAVLAYPQTTVVDAEGVPTDHWPHDSPWDGRRPSTRLASLLLPPRGLLHECSPVVGLIRTSTLRATRRIGSFGASDKVLIVELALAGDFLRVDAPLFIRRMHEATHLANRDPAEVAAWFDPHRRRGPIPTPRTDLTLGYVTAVARARLSVAERAACWRVVAQWLAIRRNWRVVAGELRRSATARIPAMTPARTSTG